MRHGLTPVIQKIHSYTMIKRTLHIICLILWLALLIPALTLHLILWWFTGSDWILDKMSCFFENLERSINYNR